MRLVEILSAIDRVHLVFEDVIVTLIVHLLSDPAFPHDSLELSIVDAGDG